MKRYAIGILAAVLLLSLGGTALARDWPAENVSLQKVWSIKFNGEVDLSTATKNIYVEGVATAIAPGEDNKTIVVKPPTGGYQPGQTYYLHINKEVMSKSGRPLTNDSANLVQKTYVPPCFGLFRRVKAKTKNPAESTAGPCFSWCLGAGLNHRHADFQMPLSPDCA